MKKLKLIFGLLLVSAFVAVTVMTYMSNDHQAVKKSDMTYIPSNG